MSARPRVLLDSPWTRFLLNEMGVPAEGCWEWIEARGEVVKRDRFSCTALLEVAGEPCFVKLYRPRSRLHGRVLRATLGRPLRSQGAARDLLRAAVRVPEPRGCLWVGDGALTLAQGLPDGEDLQRRWATGPEPAMRRELMSTAAESLARLHLGAYSHGDCKWNNLLWHDGRVYLVDLDAVRPARPGSRRQARDLARFTLNAEELAVAREDYQVFLEAYFSGLGMPREQPLARMLPELEKLRARHLHRYGEPGQPLW